MNKDCPECGGTGQYVGFNKVEPCSICGIDDCFSVSVNPHDVPPQETKMFKDILNSTINYFGKKYNDKIQDSFEKFINKQLKNTFYIGKRFDSAIVSCLAYITWTCFIKGYTEIKFKTTKEQDNFKTTVEYE